MRSRKYTKLVISFLFALILCAAPLLSFAQSDAVQNRGILTQFIDFIKLIPGVITGLVTQPSIPAPTGGGDILTPIGSGLGGFDSEEVNNPPIIAPIQGKAVIPHVPVTFQVIADDLDGDSIIYSASGLPPGAQFEPITGVFRWIPRDVHVGTSFQVTVKADDGKAIASRKVTIVVQDPNEITSVDLPSGDQIVQTNFPTPKETTTGGVKSNFAPILSFIGDQSITVGETLKLYLYATDRDQNPITYSTSRVPVGAVFNERLGIFEWTPSQPSTTRITFGASDGSLQVTESINITVREKVRPANLPPVIAALDDITVEAGSEVTFTVSARDPEGGLVLIYRDSALPVGARFSDNTFAWTPNTSQVGTYRIVFAASDGVNAVERLITIKVAEKTQGGGSGPIIFTTAFPDRTVNEAGNISFSVAATDPAGGNMTIGSVGLPLGASFVKDEAKTGTYQFSWSPSYSQSGNYTITFAATNSTQTISASALIRVININRAPTVELIPDKNVPEDQVLSFKVQASDLDDDPLSCSTTNLPQGAWFDCSTRTFSWRPAFGQGGTYNGVTFTFTDTGALTTSARTNITVTRVNQQPTFRSIAPVSALEGGLIRIPLSSFATDPDNDSLVYSGVVNSGPVAAGQAVSALGATLDRASGTFIWSPNFNQSGSYFIEFSVTDGEFIASTFAQITVSNVNRAPILNSIGSKSVQTGQLLSIVASGSDPDGDAVVFSVPVRPPGSNFATPTFTWVPSLAGSYSVTFQISDGSPDASCCSTEVVQITVTSPPPPPPVDKSTKSSSIIDVARDQIDSLLKFLKEIF